MSALCAQGLCCRYAAPGSPHCTRHRRRPGEPIALPEPRPAADGMIAVVSGCPPLARSDLVCPGCGQSLATIAPGEMPVPERHYPVLTTTQSRRLLVIGTQVGNNAGPLCDIDGDQLVAMAAVRQLAWQRARRDGTSA